MWKRQSKRPIAFLLYVTVGNVIGIIETLLKNKGKMVIKTEQPEKNQFFRYFKYLIAK